METICTRLPNFISSGVDSRHEIDDVDQSLDDVIHPLLSGNRSDVCLQQDSAGKTRKGLDLQEEERSMTEMQPSCTNDMLIDHNMNSIHCQSENNPVKNLNIEYNRNHMKGSLICSDKVPGDIKRMSASLKSQNAGHDVKLSRKCKIAAGTDDKSGTPNYTILKNHHTENQTGKENHLNCDDDSDECDDKTTLDTDSQDTDNQDCPDPLTVQKRVCLVKLYAWLKEEISRTGAKAIANHLYQHQGKLLSRADHESINHSKWRRETVELLLKKVLMGPDDVYEAFIVALKSEEEDHIIDKLEHTHVTDAEIQLFTQLEESSLHRCSRPDSDCPRFKVSGSDNETLLFYLNNINTIDSVNDQFLSKFFFSIREHTNICVCSMDKEGRVQTLLDTMRLCADKIFSDFCDILSAIEMGHVISKLERRNEGHKTCKQRQKRKSSGSNGAADTNDEVPSSSSAKRQCVDPSIEVRLVSSMQKSASNLRLHSMEQFGFDVEAVNKGSIVIQLSPQTPDSWKRLEDNCLSGKIENKCFDVEAVNKGSIVIQLSPQTPDSWKRLEDNCLSGKIKDFIPKVYDNADIYDMLKEGEYRLQFTIYTLPSRPDATEDKKVMFHLETDSQPKQEEKSKGTKSSPSENQIEENMDLLCEELEVSKDLISLLKEEKLVEKDIKEQMDKQGSRTKKIRYLLKQIESHGNKGYEVLKDFIKEENEDLYKELVHREEMKSISDTKLDQAAKVTKKARSSGGSGKGSHRKEVFFSGTVILKVTKSDIKTEKKGTDPKLDITCTEIQDPVCHFLSEDGGKEKQKSGEITMVLEDCWAPVGKEAPKRDILVGKRKTRDKKAESSDQLPLKRYCSTEEHPTSDDESSSQSSSQELASDLTSKKENKADETTKSMEKKTEKSDDTVK